VIITRERRCRQVRVESSTRLEDFGWQVHKNATSR